VSRVLTLKEPIATNVANLFGQNDNFILSDKAESGSVEKQPGRNTLTGEKVKIIKRLSKPQQLLTKIYFYRERLKKPNCKIKYRRLQIKQIKNPNLLIKELTQCLKKDKFLSVTRVKTRPL
jgi:hypothetical protein